jgi:hypothetical protein
MSAPPLKVLFQQAPHALGWRLQPWCPPTQLPCLLICGVQHLLAPPDVTIVHDMGTISSFIFNNPTGSVAADDTAADCPASCFSEMRNNTLCLLVTTFKRFDHQVTDR